MSTTKQMSDGNKVLSCSKAFLNCLRAHLAGTEGAKGDDIRSACTENTCSVGVPCAGGIYIGDACARNACNVGTVKRLGIHLQSSQILEVRLFSTGLKTRVGAD